MTGTNNSNLNPTFKLEDELDMGRNLPLTSGVGYQRVLFDMDPRASSSQGSSNHSSSLHRQGMARQNSLEMERPATLVIAFILVCHLIGYS